jgi:DNA-binding MarR family transcriptional regulator
MSGEMEQYAERFGQSLQMIFKRLVQNFGFLPNEGLTPPQFHILKMLKQKGPFKVTTLAELMGVKPSAITVMIDKLIGQGFVMREHQEDDRRVVLLSITDKGAGTVELLTKQSNETIGRFFSACSPSEIEAMVLTLEKITNHLMVQESGRYENGNDK